MLYRTTEQARAYESYAKDDRARIPTGYDSIDHVLRGGGLTGGDVLMLLARSSVGKTFFACNLAVNMRWHPSLFISLEMTTEQLVSRLCCINYDLDPRGFETGVKGGSDFARQHLKRYEQDFSKLAVYKPSDTAGAGWDDFSKALETYYEGYGEAARVVVLDFLGLVKRDQYSGAENQRIPRLAQEAERWADAMGVTLILLHQTGRANEGDPTRRNHGHIPLSMEDAMYGGEQNADYMLGMYRPENEPPPNTDPESAAYKLWNMNVQENRDIVYVQVLKNRHGPRPLDAQYPGYRFRWDWPSGRMMEDIRPIQQANYMNGG